MLDNNRRKNKHIKRTQAHRCIASHWRRLLKHHKGDRAAVAGKPGIIASGKTTVNKQQGLRPQKTRTTTVTKARYRLPPLKTAHQT
jgi:hypothetical protein